MALRKREVITKDDIINKVGEEEVFRYYWRDFKDVGKVYRSPFRRDSTPSAGVYEAKSGRLYYNDFGAKERLGCIEFVMKQYNLEYYDALKKIAGDFGLTRETLDCLPVKKAATNKRKKQKLFDVTVRNFTKADLEFWAQFEISKKELLDNQVYSVKELKINGLPIPYAEDELRFVFVVKSKKGDYYKIYAPYSEIKWISNVPIHIPFGLYDLPFKSDTCFILKAQKCRLVALKFWSDCIGFQAENVSALSDELLRWLRKKYKKIIYIGDNDRAGLEMVEHFKSKGLECYNFPEFYLSDWGVKDLSDFVNKFSVEELELWLKSQNL